ncbi:hypothetical protein [Maridesulfovibrio sp.]|uniref:hypothetical protein n=1 Tax=Maridesulfovibrio sp. TaxID=2795000 RepID=UPI003BA8B960
MKWIEFIRVRSSASVLDEAVSAVTGEVNKINESPSGAEAFMMRHGLFDGDLAVVLVWGDGIKPDKTREGLLLAGTLEQYGPVEHAVWIPAAGNYDCKNC